MVGVNKRYLTAEVGYCYGSKFCGNVYGTEALRMVIEYLLNECNFYLIETRHISGNSASERIMEKAGMAKDTNLKDRTINRYTGERNDYII